MTAPVIAYERSILAKEKDMLDAKKEALFGAFPDVPLFCKAVEDDHKRRSVVVMDYYKREKSLARFPLDVMVALDVATFQKKLKAGEFAPPS